ncbi:hypothetical protein [Streptomyces sulfonofaciens]|nr:hypothetical protein [Streptomyces sulfonofaciens]
MTAFADEARSRIAWLLRMADPDQDTSSIITYATTTADPPAMGRHGIRTRGCPGCKHTMWMQSDLWICSTCGGVEDAE